MVLLVILVRKIKFSLVMFCVLPHLELNMLTFTYAKPQQLEDLREKAAKSKRGIELALSKFFARTSYDAISLS